jgi:hypothetical protein
MLKEPMTLPFFAWLMMPPDVSKLCQDLIDLDECLNQSIHV